MQNWKPWKHTANPSALPESRQNTCTSPSLFNTCMKESLPNLHNMKGETVLMDFLPTVSPYDTPPWTNRLSPSVYWVHKTLSRHQISFLLQHMRFIHQKWIILFLIYSTALSFLSFHNISNFVNVHIYYLFLLNLQKIFRLSCLIIVLNFLNLSHLWRTLWFSCCFREQHIALTGHKYPFIHC